MHCRSMCRHQKLPLSACIQGNCSTYSVPAQPPNPVLHAVLCHRTCVRCNTVWLITRIAARLAFAASIYCTLPCRHHIDLLQPAVQHKCQPQRQPGVDAAVLLYPTSATSLQFRVQQVQALLQMRLCNTSCAVVPGKKCSDADVAGRQQAAAAGSGICEHGTRAFTMHSSHRRA